MSSTKPPPSSSSTSWASPRLATSKTSASKSSSSKPTRFPTLKVFKFAQSKGDAPPVLAAGDLRRYQPPSRSQSRNGDRIHEDDYHDNDAQDLPPPPPPKDSFYLYNRSLNSLPTTPQSSNFPQAPSPNPTHSTMSLASTAASAIESSTRQGKLKGKGSIAKSFLKLTKRGATSTAPKSPQLSPSPDDDQAISLPWNFQVRPGLHFLPP
jgi:hypothetical protein